VDPTLPTSALLYPVRDALMRSRIGPQSTREPHEGCASRDGERRGEAREGEELYPVAIETSSVRSRLSTWWRFTDNER